MKNLPNAFQLYRDGKTTERVGTVFGFIAIGVFILMINYVHKIASMSDRFVLMAMMFWFLAVAITLLSKGSAMKHQANTNYGYDGEEYY